MNKQFCVLNITRRSIAATPDTATREGHHGNIVDISSKCIGSQHAK